MWPQHNCPVAPEQAVWVRSLVERVGLGKTLWLGVAVERLSRRGGKGTPLATVSPPGYPCVENGLLFPYRGTSALDRARLPANVHETRSGGSAESGHCPDNILIM